MHTRRLATTGVALVAALGLALTGCGNQNGTDTPAAGAAPTSSAPADARAELTTAALKLNEDSLRVTMKSAMINGGGLMDPETRNADMTMDLGALGKMRMISLGGDAWMRFTGMSTALPDKWLHMDADKLGASGQLSLMDEDDPGNAKKLIAGVTTVEKTGERSFAGTLDYAKAKPDDKSLKALGDKARAVPFTARTDDRGRLVELVLDTSVLVEGLGKMTTTYTDFGVAVNPTRPPAGQTQEAPKEFLEAFDN